MGQKYSSAIFSISSPTQHNFDLQHSYILLSSYQGHIILIISTIVISTIVLPLSYFFHNNISLFSQWVTPHHHYIPHHFQHTLHLHFTIILTDSFTILNTHFATPHQPNHTCCHINFTHTTTPTFLFSPHTTRSFSPHYVEAAPPHITSQVILTLFHLPHHNPLHQLTPPQSHHHLTAPHRSSPPQITPPYKPTSLHTSQTILASLPTSSKPSSPSHHPPHDSHELVVEGRVQDEVERHVADEQEVRDGAEDQIEGG